MAKGSEQGVVLQRHGELLEEVGATDVVAVAVGFRPDDIVIARRLVGPAPIYVELAVGLVPGLFRALLRIHLRR